MAKTTLECTTVDPEIFFSMNQWDQKQAKTICGRCPIRRSCRTQGREGREFGIWGGEDEDERIAVLTGRSPIPSQLIRSNERLPKYRYRRNWTEQDMIEAHEMHCEGLTIKQISVRFVDELTGLSPHHLDLKYALYHWRIRRNIPSPKERMQAGVFTNDQRDREMLQLHHGDGLSYTEIGVIYQMKVSAVKQAIFRMKVRLQAEADVAIATTKGSEATNG